MAKVINLRYHHDSGHGWIAVKSKLINDLNLADKITSFSYMKGKTVYLEEDCDASIFIEALKNNNIDYIMKESFASCSTRNRSPIRGYQSYRPTL